MALRNERVSIVVCGHVHSGISTTTGRLIFEMGGVTEREMQQFREEANRLGKGSFVFEYFLERRKEQRLLCAVDYSAKEFFTNTKHYTYDNAPGHRNFVKNNITGASQADVALIMVPADGDFAAAIRQTRQHALVLKLIGVKQIIVGVNKMDCDLAGYKEERYLEVKDEVIKMLTKVGWKEEFATNSVPVLPLSGGKGDNFLKISENMPWWKGCDVQVKDQSLHIETLYEALDLFIQIPPRPKDVPMRTPISGIYKIKGSGDVAAGRVEQGTIKPGDEVVFLPTHTPSVPCEGEVIRVEVFRKYVSEAVAGDNIGLNIRGLKKENMPRAGDIIVLKKDLTLKICKQFTVLVFVFNHPGERLKVGYTPIAYVRTSRSAVKMVQIKWKIGKETDGKKVEDPVYLKANQFAEVIFEPQQPFIVDLFSNCEGLGRVAIMEDATVVMLGKVVDVQHTNDN